MVREKDSFLRRMRRKYRLAILDDITLREVFHMKMSGLGTFTTLMVSFIILLALLSALIVLTPIRNILPGYSESIRQQLITETARVDSLQTTLTLQSQYIEVIKQITTGNIQTDSIERLDSMEIIEGAKLLDVKNADTDAFMAQYEQKEKDRLLLFDTQRKRNVQQLYRPAGGVVVRSARPDRNQYGVAIRVVNHENVLSVLGGTIVLREADMNNAYTIVIQHSQYLSIYRNVTVPLKQQGTYVQAGESIGMMDGDAELEFELWEAGKPIDPEQVIIF